MTGESFDLIYEDDEIWFIEFYAPWCGHCKALLPEFETAARNLKGTGVTFGKVDCTQETQLCQRFEVKGYPTVKLIPKGAKSDVEAVEYRNKREAWEIEQFAHKWVEGRGEDTLMDEEGRVGPEPGDGSDKFAPDENIVDLTTDGFDLNVWYSEKLWFIVEIWYSRPLKVPR